MAPHHGSPMPTCINSSRFWIRPTGVALHKPSSDRLASAPAPCRTSNAVRGASATCSVIGGVTAGAGSAARLGMETGTDRAASAVSLGVDKLWAASIVCKISKIFEQLKINHNSQFTIPNNHCNNAPIVDSKAFADLNPNSVFFYPGSVSGSSRNTLLIKENSFGATHLRAVVSDCHSTDQQKLAMTGTPQKCPN